MESASFSLIISNIIKLIPYELLIPITIMALIIFCIYKYCQKTYITQIDFKEEREKQNIKIAKIETKSLSYEQLIQKFNQINLDLSKYVLKDEYDIQIGYFDTKLDSLENKINDNQTILISEINQNERRINNFISDKIDLIYNKLFDLYKKD